MFFQNKLNSQLNLIDTEYHPVKHQKQLLMYNVHHFMGSFHWTVHLSTFKQPSKRTDYKLKMHIGFLSMLNFRLKETF